MSEATERRVFVAGGTGYMGRRLIETLSSRGHHVQALTRAESKSKLPSACTAVIGNALDAASYSDHIRHSDTFVHLVGVSHPSPTKAAQFRAIDLESAKIAVANARAAGVQHFVYVSVAHPAPVMKPYIEARMEAEEAIRTSGMNASILRPWYVLGPGHRWPYALLPIYWLLEKLPATREGAQRLGLVRLNQMVAALTAAVENPPEGVRIYAVPEIRRFAAISSR